MHNKLQCMATNGPVWLGGKFERGFWHFWKGSGALKTIPMCTMTVWKKILGGCDDIGEPKKKIYFEKPVKASVNKYCLSKAVGKPMYRSLLKSSAKFVISPKEI
jgi:hypothetical protein